MIDPKAKYTVLLDDNGTFIDLSDNAADLTRDNFNVQLVAAEDKLYIGLYKPFGSLYVELFSANTNAGGFVAEIHNGTTWETIDLTDESKGWTRSGFMFWESADMKATTVNSIEKYYIRLTPTVDHSATVVRGINLIFADDSAMKAEFFEITNSNILPAGENSHIGTHIASRNYIMHDLRNHYVKSAGPEITSVSLEKINQFDMLDVFEIREAACYLSLSKIFFNLSDTTEDHWWAKYREYQDKFEQKMILARLTIDKNNDGIVDNNEKQSQFNPVRWAR